MAEPKSGPPERKEVIPGYIDDILDNRDKHGVPNFTAAQIAGIISENDEYGAIDEVHRETVRNWLNKMIDGDVRKDDGSKYDIEKFKLGPRTVIYGRTNDPSLVLAQSLTAKSIGKGLITIAAVVFLFDLITAFIGVFPLGGGLRFTATLMLFLGWVLHTYPGILSPLFRSGRLSRQFHRVREVVE